MEMSITQYAEKMGVTRQAILLQIHEGRLPVNVKARQVGHAWVLEVKEEKEKKEKK